MKIALISVTKPIAGTRDKVTEYTYQLYNRFSKNKNNEIDLIYAIGETKASNTIGLIYTNTIFRSTIPGLVKKHYDIIHITNQEVGFAAKILRGAGEKGIIITTVHDTLRMRNDLHRGIRQKMYNNLTTLNIRNALETSNLIIFDDEKTKEEVSGIHDVKESMIIPLGIDDNIVHTPLKNKTRKGKFVIGYIGDFLTSNKNLMLIMKAANLMKKDKSCSFVIYGSGTEQESLNMYKIANGLDNVEFRTVRHGFGPVEVYDSFDVFVYPALGESYSLPIIEAFARGLPVIIDERTRYIEEVKDNCTTVKDEQELAKKLKDIKVNGYSKNVINSGLKYARTFNWDRTTEETYKVYKKLAGR